MSKTKRPELTLLEKVNPEDTNILEYRQPTKTLDQHLREFAELLDSWEYETTHFTGTKPDFNTIQAYNESERILRDLMQSGHDPENAHVIKQIDFSPPRKTDPMALITIYTYPYALWNREQFLLLMKVMYLASNILVGTDDAGNGRMLFVFEPVWEESEIR